MGHGAGREDSVDLRMGEGHDDPVGVDAAARGVDGPAAGDRGDSGDGRVEVDGGAGRSEGGGRLFPVELPERNA